MQQTVGGGRLDEADRRLPLARGGMHEEELGVGEHRGAHSGVAHLPEELHGRHPLACPLAA